MQHPRLGAAVFATLVVAGGAIVSCRAERADRAAGAAPAVRSEMLVTTAWLQEHVGDSNVVVVHVARDRSVFDTAHVPGARFLSWNDVATTRDGLPNELPRLEQLVATIRRLGIDSMSRVILYSEDPGLIAARAYVAFDYAGIGDSTALLDGGWRVWTAEHRTVTADTSVVRPTAYAPHFDPDALIMRRVVRDVVWSRDACGDLRFALVDARPRAQYIGTEPGEHITRSGHIPGAVNIPWLQDVESEDHPVLRSPDELRARLRALNVPPVGATIVTYCRTGGQASHTYFTLRYLGYDVRLYDGSYIDWSADSTLPVIGPKDTIEISNKRKASCQA
ncbi:MAG TPA: sulfurtransferase [Gemmatimonadales bacterium]|nr:sulfurtransferase [Gemmatimonadales bacterium]